MPETSKSSTTGSANNSLTRPDRVRHHLAKLRKRLSQPLLHSVQWHRVDGFHERRHFAARIGTEVVERHEVVRRHRATRMLYRARQIFFRRDDREARSIKRFLSGVVFEERSSSKLAKRPRGHGVIVRINDAIERAPLDRRAGIAVWRENTTYPQRTPPHAVLPGRRRRQAFE